MKRELERLEIPGELEARGRAWALARTAFAERAVEPRRLAWKPVAALALVLAVLAAAFSPPGRSVIDTVRERIGVEHAQPALFSLPSGGRLLVTSDAGAWVVEADGSKRLLGRYRDAAWSPFGRYVVATRPNELVALEPGGRVRWSLARPDVRSPRWGGTRTDTRIAYVSAGNLRVVGGDGKGDRLLARGVAATAPVWRPGPGHRLAYALRDGSVRVVDADRGTVLDRSAPRSLVRPPARLRSPNGRWIVSGWAAADQLVFLRVEGPRRIVAVSDVSRQFRSRSFPAIRGWCCAP